MSKLSPIPAKSLLHLRGRAEQVFVRDRYEAQLDPASRLKLEQRQAAEEAVSGLGHWPIMLVLEMLKQAGVRHAWAEMEAVGILGRIKLRGMIDGVPGEIDPRWLAFLAFKPDGGVIYFDQEKARQKAVMVPVRASNVTVEIAGIEEVWPPPGAPLNATAAPKEVAEAAKRSTTKPRKPRPAIAGWWI
jgi:hypothetical protein